ncbi:MAG: hypothetical protein ABSH08_04155 [Tepidisphaeraceae bacterium]|jgi:hypothetical protein
MRHSFVGCVLLLWAGAAVYGQTAPSPAERMLNEMLNPAPAAAPPTTRPGQAQVLEPSGYVPKSNNSQLLREGTDVIARSGHLKKSPEGPYPLFVFDPQPNLSPIQPMLVLPNLQLMSMEDAASETRQNLKFTVSGILTEYRGKNYILLEPGPDEISRQTPSTSFVPAGAHGPAPAEQMLSAMLAAEGPSSSAPPRSVPPQNDLTTGSGALPPKAPLLTLLPEQSQIFDRVCRLSPGADPQQLQITLEADGAALQDPPLIVLPNLKLTALENASGGLHDTRFRVSGVVTEYRGRNYILLQKVVVMADSDRQF